jgi:hypothetical protein|tara:strand:+ start:12127 stop:12321 length:195 start_codon:yes stop_codon:yes gene_type:complete
MMANEKPVSLRKLKKMTYRQVVAEWSRQSDLRKKANRDEAKQKTKKQPKVDAACRELSGRFQIF